MDGSKGSLVPDDLRRSAGGARGIGGAAPENAGAAAARARAMGGAPVAAEESEAIAALQAPAAKTEACTRCKRETEEEWNYCAKCGADLVKDLDPGKKLGITFSEGDIEDYLFRGYVSRELPILGKHKFVVKSSQPKDSKLIDAWFMDGPYKEKRLSGDLLKKLEYMAMAAVSIPSFDEKTIGKDLTERMEWFEERGSAFVDMLGDRVVLFNRALTKYLEGQNLIMGS